MKPKVMHQQAMELSFMAKQFLDEDNYAAAFEYYKKAADLESQVAEFYLDKPELEPTRSVLIRSAAFLNLKAGLIEEAQKYIFFGLLNIKDVKIVEQLNNALELVVSLRNLNSENASREFNYLSLLRQRSVHYILEPTTPEFGHSVSLEMIKDFSDGYLKSLKAYAKSLYKKAFEIATEIESSTIKEIEKLINPLVTQSSYGSFKFSIANDYLTRVGEDKKLVDLKSNVVLKYHNEIFINPLTDEDISIIKNKYSEEDVNEIFRPLTKIKSNNTPFRIGYYNNENLQKVYVNKIINKQKQKLITVKQLSQEDIGELENSIIHKRSSAEGKVFKKTIFKEQMRLFEFDIKTNLINPKDASPLIINEDIIITVNFNSESGFKFTFDDFKIETTDTEYERGLIKFHTDFYQKILTLKKSDRKFEQEQRDWIVINRLIGNIDAIH